MWQSKKKREQVGITGPTQHPDIKKCKDKDKCISKVTPLRFEFLDKPENWTALLQERITAFTHSSSFVGQVIYDSEVQEMSIILAGEKYVFCGVPDRVYDAFEGATSKGSFFTREIKGQFDC